MKTINQDANVTKDDQKNINTFSKMYSRHQQMVKQLSDLKQKINKHDDTLGELQLKEMQGDQDQIVRYRFGNFGQASELVQKDKAKVQKQFKAKQQQSDQNEKKMKKLKATLYSKFGNSINLED